MTAILATILTKVGIGKLLLGSGLAGGLIIALAKKYIPNLFGDWLKSALAKELQPNLSDPIERGLFVDMVKGICRFVEYKIPDNPGADKFEKVKAFLMRFVSEKGKVIRCVASEGPGSATTTCSADSGCFATSSLSAAPSASSRWPSGTKARAKPFTE